MAQFLASAPRGDKSVFILRPCILILKVAKNFRQIFFGGVELVDGLQSTKNRIEHLRGAS